MGCMNNALMHNHIQHSCIILYTALSWLGCVNIFLTNSVIVFSEHQSCAIEATKQTHEDLLGINNVREVLDQLWEYRSKWRLIGIELGIKPSDLDAIAENTRKVEDSLLEVIKSWLRCANPKPTRTVLTAVTQSKLLITEEEAHSDPLVIQAESQSVTQVVSTQEGSTSTAQGLCCVCFRQILVRRRRAREAVTQSGVVSTQEGPDYARYLKSLYKAKSLASFADNEWPPPCTDKVFRLAMIRGEEIRRGYTGDDAVLREKTISGKVDDVLQRMIPVEIKHVFNVNDQEKEVKKVLMEGAPGSGKSTLSFHICRQWMEGHLFQEYKLVILMRLREFDIQNAKRLAELLPRRDEAMGIEIEDTITATDGKDVLFILDGWDELPRNVPVYPLILNLVRGNMLPATSIIVTSRPTSSAILHRLVHLQIEILGFTKDELQQYFKKCLENDKNAVQRLLQRIKQNPIIEGSCYLPLNASILVHLFKCGDNVLPKTQYGIFTDLVCTCIFRHLKKTHDHQDIVGLESLDDLPCSTAVQFRHLCKIAYNGVMQDKVIFDLGPSFNTLGLLQGVESFAKCGKSYSYNFLHLSIQELLCALHMANELDEREQTEQFKKLFGQPRFMLVFQFFAAKTKLKTSGISEIVNQVAKKCSGDCPSGEDRTLLVSLMHCLYEAHDSSLCQLVAGKLKQKLIMGTYNNGIRLNPTDCYYLGYFLTFCTGFDVHLTSCSIGVEHCKSLFRSGEVYNFLSLDITFNSIGDEGAMAVAAAMKTATNLKWLYLDNNSIGGEGAVALAAALETAYNLEWLGLADNSIGKEGAMAMATAMKTATNLQELNLAANNIGGEAQDAIRAAAKKTRTKININGYWE